jgi:hypothetical protein
MCVKLLWTVSYLLVIAGSVGMVLFATKFPLSAALWELAYAKQRLIGLNGQQVWRCSWIAILAGSVGQLVAVWLQ